MRTHLAFRTKGAVATGSLIERGNISTVEDSRTPIEGEHKFEGNGGVSKDRCYREEPIR